MYTSGAGDRAVTVNYIGASRIDTLASSDGVFTEDYSGTHNALVNAVGLSTTGKPYAIVWTYGMPAPEVADDYFGAQLFVQGPAKCHRTPTPLCVFLLFSSALGRYVKAFPMAPVFGADHSITPESAGPAGLALYAAYGPLFSGAITLVPFQCTMGVSRNACLPLLSPCGRLLASCGSPNRRGGRGRWHRCKRFHARWGLHSCWGSRGRRRPR